MRVNVIALTRNIPFRITRTGIGLLLKKKNVYSLSTVVPKLESRTKNVLLKLHGENISILQSSTIRGAFDCVPPIPPRYTEPSLDVSHKTLLLSKTFDNKWLRFRISGNVIDV